MFGNLDFSELWSLALSDLLGPVGLLLSIPGLVVIGLVLFRPRSFWYVVLAGALIGSGPKFGGYVVLDEGLLYAAVIGAYMRILLLAGRIRTAPRRRHSLEPFWYFVTYLIAMTFVGMAITYEVRLLRFALLYSALWSLWLITTRFRALFPFPPVYEFVRFTLWTGVVYLVS